MYLQKKFRFGLLTILAGLVVSTLPLSAQQVYKGTFDLPFETRWGGATLEPGHYTVTVEQGFTMKLIRVQGEGGNLISVARPSTVEPFTGPGRITLAHVGGTYAAERLDAGSLGESFTFALPKSLKGESAHGVEGTQDTVAVSTR